MQPTLSPVFLEFATHLQVIKNRSAHTVEMYLSDIALFFRYLGLTAAGGDPADPEAFAAVDLSSLTVADVGAVTTIQIYQFLNYCSSVRKNAPRALARKLSSLRTFYRFWAGNRRAIADDPTRNIDSPNVQKTLPKYLTLEESTHLLEVVLEDTESETRARDFAILTLFLNCGMRLSELCGINLADIDPELRSLRVLGKGRKERIVYLNDACRDALGAYFSVREKDEAAEKEPALFLSGRHQRISNKTVQWMVYKYLRVAGLGNRHLSTHKLRHTAATLMYQTGEVDVLMLKEILGHESVGTTQIYTHVSNEGMAQAMSKNPLAKLTDRKISRRVREEAAVREGWIRAQADAMAEVARAPEVTAEPAPETDAPLPADAQFTPPPAESEPVAPTEAVLVENTPIEDAKPVLEAPEAPSAPVSDDLAEEMLFDDPADAFDFAEEELWESEPTAEPAPASAVDLARLQDVIASLRKQYGVPEDED